MKNKATSIILVICGIVLFVIIAYVVITNTSTTTAVVPNQDLVAGTTINDEMLQKITVPSNTPQGYIADSKSLIGQKLKVNVSQGQFLYTTDVMTSWDEMLDGEDIPDNYVITSMFLPAERTVGGLINTGDSVDVLGVPNSQGADIDSATMENYLGDMAKYDSYGTDQGINTYWVLANVKVLQTNSTIASSENSSLSSLTNEDEGGTGSSDGAYYIVALSYADYQKLRLSENYLDLWLSLCPSQNDGNDPLYDQMRQKAIKVIQDAQKQPKEYLEAPGNGDYGDFDAKLDDTKSNVNDITNNEQGAAPADSAPADSGQTPDGQ